MAMLLRVEIIIWDSATFHPWMREWHTSRCLLVDVIQCFYEVMGRVWPADVISLTSATFHLQRRGVSGWVSQLQAVDICAMPIWCQFAWTMFCNSALLFKMMLSSWYSQVCQETKCSAWMLIGLIWPMKSVSALHVNWMLSYWVLEWSCPMDTWLHQPAVQIQGPR